MRLQVKGKNVEVTAQIRAYAEEKLGKLERQLNGPTRVELELAVERNPSISANNIAEATIWTKGPDRCLGDVVRGDGRVPLDRELELDTGRAVQLAFQLAELLLGIRPDLRGDLD